MLINYTDVKQNKEIMRALTQILIYKGLFK